jgi:isoquinoline 1-oxidoreductase
MSSYFAEPERYELSESARYIFRPTRRGFLLGAGLLILAIEESLNGQTPQERPRLHAGDNGVFTVFTGKVEEGQGALTEIAMAAAEELEVPLDRVRVQMADTELTPDDGITAGSRTTPATVPAVRQACAAYRKRTSPTPAADWNALGKPEGRVDAREIVTGRHRYPSDLTRPGMLYGAVLRPPSFQAKLQSVHLAAARQAGAIAAARDGEFAGCVAKTSYEARKALSALEASARWEQSPATVATPQLFDHLKQTARTGGEGRNRPVQRGDVEATLASASRRIHASFRVAYIQHAPMEPRAALAEWTNGRLTVWTGTSNPFAVRTQLAQAFQLPPAAVRVIVPHFGGGFGGKHPGEAALEAARLAREAGAPVKVRWTREEEFTWAYARPAGLIEIAAALNQQGGIAAWDFVNYNSGASAIDTPYRTPNARIRYVPSDSPLRQGSYRALASTANNFARESFLDEVAAAAGRDPLDFRIAELENERIRAVLMAAAERFGWRERVKRRAPNRGVGLACGTEKNSVVAACVEVEVDPRTGTPKLLEICQAFECGAILNPQGLRAQVEGCILMGLGAALREELKFENGRIANPRFSRYRVTRFRDVPRMDVLLLDRKDREPAGAGETPIIAVAPAMANAIFHATGRRVRSLPLRLEPRPSGS